MNHPMTDPKQDVRQQFEAKFREPPYEFPMKRGSSNAGWPGQYRDYSVQCAWEGYQAALQSPAVRGLVEAIEQYRSDYRTEGCPLPECVVCARSNAAKARLTAALAPFTALRTLGAGHVE